MSSVQFPCVRAILCVPRTQERQLRRDARGNIAAALVLPPALFDTDEPVYYVDRPVTARFTRYIVGANPAAAPRWPPGDVVSRLRTFVKVIFLCKYAAAFEGPHMVRFVPPARFLSVHPCCGPCATQEAGRCGPTSALETVFLSLRHFQVKPTHSLHTTTDMHTRSPTRLYE
jgi:hypothetical protein